MKYTKDNTIADVLENDPEKQEILSEHLSGSCFGCPMSQVETLGEAAGHHGADVKKLLADLNKEKKEK